MDFDKATNGRYLTTYPREKDKYHDFKRFYRKNRHPDGSHFRASDRTNANAHTGYYLTHSVICPNNKTKTAQAYACAAVGLSTLNRQLATRLGAEAGHGHAVFAGLVARRHAADAEGVR